MTIFAKISYREINKKIKIAYISTGMMHGKENVKNDQYVNKLTD